MPYKSVLLIAKGFQRPSQSPELTYDSCCCGKTIRKKNNQMTEVGFIPMRVEC